MIQKWITFILFLTIQLYGSGNISQSKMVLTLEESVNIALKQNPEIQIARKELEKANAGVWESYSTILPHLDASANLQHNWKIQQSTIPNFIKTMLGPTAPPGMPDYVQIAFGLENTFTYGASINQPLFLGGAGIAGIQAANSSKRMMEHNLDAKRQDLIFQTANAYYSCILAQELMTVQEEALAQAQANLDMVKKKYDVGAASGFDKMRAKVEVSNLQPGLISAQNNLQSALTNLRTVLGLGKEVAIEVIGELEYTQDQIDSLTLTELQQMALNNRPEKLAMQARMKIAKKGITIARSNFLPKLYFNTDYSFLASRNDFKFSQEDFSEGFTSAISLQIPLFHGFSSVKQYQKAKLDYKITVDSDQQMVNGIVAEVEFAYNKLSEAKEKLLSSQETVDLAKESLRLANLMYEEGTNTQLDVLNARLSLTQAQMNYVSSLYEYQVARYQLRKATGQLEGII